MNAAQVQILSQNPKTPLAVVKDYVTRHLQEERDLITQDQKVTQNLSTIGIIMSCVGVR